MVRALVRVDAEETSVRYLTPGDLDRCAMTEEEARARAGANLDVLLGSISLDARRIGGHELVWTDSDSVSKPSLIFAPSLRGAIDTALGWPVMAVASARDFLYLFACSAAPELVPRLSGVVMDEFERSAYPVTREVLEISSTGVRAVGACSR